MTFTITLMDPLASPGVGRPHQLTFTIAADANYTFAGGAKSVTHPRSIELGTVVSITETIHGVDNDKLLFEVAVCDETQTRLGGVLITVLAAPALT